MIPLKLILAGWLILAIVFALGWVWSWRHRNAGLVDVLWAFSLGGLIALGAWWLDSGDPGRRGLLLACTGLWSIRLGWHIWQRFRREEEEDARYAALREHWGAAAEVKLFGFFQVQALANVFLSAPIFRLMANSAPLTLWDWLGALLIVGAVVGERSADAQLVAWKRDPANRGRTCRRGLWAWSRHPNYFFEWVHWLGYPVMGLTFLFNGQFAAWGLTALGPIVMLLLLLRGTGIPYTEKQALRSRGEDYRRYQREVSAFFPWPPSRSDRTDPSTTTSTRS